MVHGPTGELSGKPEMSLSFGKWNTSARGVTLHSLNVYLCFLLRFVLRRLQILAVSGYLDFSWHSSTVPVSKIEISLLR